MHDETLPKEGMEWKEALSASEITLGRNDENDRLCCWAGVEKMEEKYERQYRKMSYVDV